MITYSGRSVWPSDTPEPDVPTDVSPSLEDIAVGLGRTPRFAGQTRLYYTVLCHSFCAARLASKLLPADANLQRWCLLHDAHEAIIGDVPTTWKHDRTKQDGDELDVRIALELRLEPLDERQAAVLKQIDAALLAAEAHELGHSEAEKWWPEASHDRLVRQARALTLVQLQLGNPVHYLEPRNAIEAMRVLWQGWT